MAETMLFPRPAARDGGQRYQVVVSVDHDSLAGTDADIGGEIDDVPWLSAESSWRWRPDWSVVAMSLVRGSEPLEEWAATSTISRHIRRTLRKRDCGCRFPGCGQRRFVDDVNRRLGVVSASTSASPSMPCCAWRGIGA